MPGSPGLRPAHVSKPRGIALSSRKPAKTRTRPSASRMPPSTCCAPSASKRCSAIPARPNCRSSATGPTTSITCWACRKASVVGMADGYAQATRNAGFVNLHSGAGVGNALGNIFTAHRNQTPLVITAGQQARSILPCRHFSMPSGLGIPAALREIQRRAGAAEDVPAAIARAYYVAMQPPCGPTFVSIPIDDWTHATSPVEAREVSRELGPGSGGHEEIGVCAHGGQAPCAGGRPRRRPRAGRRADGKGRRESKGRGVGEPVLGAMLLPERHPQFAGFLHASPAQLSDALREHDLWW